MKPITITSAVLLALAIALHSTTSMAEAVIYPGISCAPYYGTQAADFNIGSHGIRNNSSGTRLVSCPINRATRNNIWMDASKYVYVNFDSKSSPITCFVYNMDGSGEIHSYGIATGLVEIAINTNSRTDTSYQSLFCYLPGGAVLDSYVPISRP